MDAFIGVIIGGLVSVVTTLSIDTIRSRREMRHRWDGIALDAITQFIEKVNIAIGMLYDEGRSRHALGSDDERTRQLDRASRSAMDSVRVSHARARLLMNSIGDSLWSYFGALGQLKALADEGFPAGDPRWEDIQAQLRSELDQLLVRVTQTLRIQQGTGDASSSPA